MIEKSELRKLIQEVADDHEEVADGDFIGDLVDRIEREFPDEVCDPDGDEEEERHG